jgi:hypothetical protein
VREPSTDRFDDDKQKGLLLHVVHDGNRGVSNRTFPAFLRRQGLTLALLGCVLIVEIPAYAGLIDYRLVREALTDPSTPDISFVEDRELSYRRAPHFHWRSAPTGHGQLLQPADRASHTLTFSTDRDGFRNREEINRADIALIGDSYVEGFAVSDEDTVAAKLHQTSGVVMKNPWDVRRRLASGTPRAKEVWAYRRTPTPG